jgi:hypothetical protein
MIALAALISLAAVLLNVKSEQPQAQDSGTTFVSQNALVTTSAPFLNARTNSYTARYERYGAFGLYHVSLAVDLIQDGVSVQRFHIDGAGRLPKYELNLGVCKMKFRLPPVYLAGSVNPRGYKQHFLGMFTSNEFGPTYHLTPEQGSKLVSMAHRALTTMNHSDDWLYCTLPFRIGSLQFWTSNSVVASLVEVANEDGIKLPKPEGGCYPGFDGPYLSKSLFK